MVATIEQQAGQKPTELVADSGYCSEQNLEHLEHNAIDGYVSTIRQKHGRQRVTCKRGPLPLSATRVDRMRRKLQTKAGARIYAARKSIVEPLFGQIKQAQQNPEQYRDLVVRVAGYSAYFTQLNLAMQDEVITRTELSFANM
jgi:hypothetical protein